MARYYENTTTFNFSWDQVARGYWKRYPNPQRYLFSYNNKNTVKLEYRIYFTVFCTYFQYTCAIRRYLEQTSKEWMFVHKKIAN